MTEASRQDRDAPAYSTKVSCVGVLLAGGLSRRMGGGDKGLEMLAGRPMLAHAIERLRPQVGQLVLNANGDAERFAAFALPVVADASPDFAGPLAGVLAGMRWSEANVPDAAWIATAACDTPFFPRDLVARLRTAAEEDNAAVASAASGGQGHHVFGLWDIRLADGLEAALANGQRKVQDWIARYPHVAVNFAPARVGGATIDPFYNINTPDDLAQAEALLGEERP